MAAKRVCAWPEAKAALNADLIRVGHRVRDIGSERFTWSDAACFIAHVKPGDALYQVLTESGWGPAEFVLADLYDMVQGMRLEALDPDDRPSFEPYPRPGDEPVEPETLTGGEGPVQRTTDVTEGVIRGDVMTLEDAKRLWPNRDGDQHGDDG